MIPHQPSLKSTVPGCWLDFGPTFSRKLVMINDKYLSSNSFLIWNNAIIHCCNHFRCHIYRYLLNIRTMLEGWEGFWWAGDLNVHFALWWLRDSNILSWLGSCLCLQYIKAHGLVYMVDYLCSFHVYLFDHCDMILIIQQFYEDFSIV